MSIQHTVIAGDHLSAIADQYGFKDYLTIWDHPDNAALKQQRADPHVLQPGDVVTVPDRLDKSENRATGSSHRFRVAARPLKLRIALKDFDNQPISGAACVLTVDGKVHELVSDGDGMIEVPISNSAKRGVLQLPELDIEHEVMIGHLDPVDEDSGWQGRLVNLGYHPGAVGDEDQQSLRHSLEEFQCDHGLAVTGEPEDATQALLLQVHGS